jgi:betaine-aldehyde dehydrogenase
MREALNYIDGKWCGEGKKGNRTSPLNDQPFSTAVYASASDIGRAVGAAKKAQKSWAELSVTRRAEYVMGIAAALRKRYGSAGEDTELKKTIREEVGKPLPEADIEVLESADFFEYFCRVAPEVLADEKPELNKELWPTKTSMIVHEPYGVVAIIKPWNYPLEMIAWALAPALLAGNTVVVKPSEKSPITALAYADAAQEAGLPHGVLNIVLGDASVGRELVAHAGIDYVSFTGSRGVGKEIAQVCAPSFRPCSLELSGNDVAVVLEDADPSWVSHGLVWGAFCNAGQVCVGIKRAFVPANQLQAYISEIGKLVDELVVGRDVGPIVDQLQLDNFVQALTKLRSEGAQFLRGGNRLGGPGLFVEPTVVLVGKESFVHREEIFGPLLPISTYENVDTVVNDIADAEHALGASVWTKNLDGGAKLARQLNVGMVWVNDVNVAFAEAPWPARRQSGMGFSLSKDSLKTYTRPKHISVDTDIEKPRFWWYPYKQN